MNNRISQQKYQAGFTLGELGLVLLIVAIIAMFAYPKFIEYNQNVLASEEADNIIHYASKTKSAYSMDSSFATVTTEALRTTGIFPSSMVQGTTVVNNYQGTVTAAPNTITNTSDSVLFTSTNYSQEGCSDVVPRITSVARLIFVNGTVVKEANSPLSRDALGIACTSEENTVTFVISK